VICGGCPTRNTPPLCASSNSRQVVSVPGEVLSQVTRIISKTSSTGIRLCTVSLNDAFSSIVGISTVTLILPTKSESRCCRWRARSAITFDAGSGDVVQRGLARPHTKGGRAFRNRHGLKRTYRTQRTKELVPRLNASRASGLNAQQKAHETPPTPIAIV